MWLKQQKLRYNSQNIKPPRTRRKRNSRKIYFLKVYICQAFLWYRSQLCTMDIPIGDNWLNKNYSVECIVHPPMEWVGTIISVTQLFYTEIVFVDILQRHKKLSAFSLVFPVR